LSKEDDINKIIENSREDIIYLQKELTKRPALSPLSGGEGEIEVHKFIKDFCIESGFECVQEFLSPDKRVSSGVRPSLVVTIKGKSDRAIWFMSHTDIVPAGELSLWKTDPFEAVVVGDRIYGRGTEDNRQSLVASLLSARAVMKSGVIPERTIKLLFVADEETGSDYGIKWLVKNTGLFDKNDLFIVPDHGDPSGDTIEIAEKGILWVSFKIHGAQSHGSRPDLGINASRAAAYLTVEIDRLREKYPEADEKFDYPYSSFEPTRRIGSVQNMNTIPGEETLGFDCRILPCYLIDSVYNDIKIIAKNIEKQYSVKIELSIEQMAAATKTEGDSEVVTLLSDAVRKVTGITPRLIGVGGGTVASPLRMLGYRAALWSTIESTMHSPNEFSSIANTLNDMRVFAEVMLSS